MMTYTMHEADLLNDEVLVGLSLEGDRDAFGQIVARYQSPICALAYSACGSIPRSEDLAQEVFIAAWRKLRDLKDPASLKAWLYGIARHLINSSFRRQFRNPLAAADPLDKALETGTEFCGPSEAAMSKEEEALLWQVLSGLPEIYRQPLILFYRQEESAQSVADILGISEEAARQRLSRGRAMLNERVAKVVEIGLRRSGPSKTFGLAVLAALPAASIKASTIGAGTASIKASSALTGSGLVKLLGPVASSILSLAGGAASLWGRVRNALSVQERAFTQRTTWGFLALGAAFVVSSQLLFARGNLRMSIQPADVMAWSLFWVGFLGPLFGFTIWRGRKIRQIRLIEGVLPARSTWQMWAPDPARPGFLTATYGTLACIVFGTCGWLLIHAIDAKDRTCIMLLPILCVSIWLLGGSAIVRQPAKSTNITSRVWWSLALVNLVFVNARWDSWFGGAPGLAFSGLAAPWTVDYAILFFFGTSQLGWWLRSTFMALADARRAALLAISLYAALVLSGAALLVMAK